MVTVTPDVVVILAVTFVALVLFAVEPVRIDVIAIGLMVTLLLLEPATEPIASLGVLSAPISVFDDPVQGVSGFSSTATIVILSMFILSEGIRRTGCIETVTRVAAEYTGDDERRQLGATIGIVTPVSGAIGNTAAVAILIPMVKDLASRGGNSPSKLLLPLSYASMFGGTLTLIGTSTNVVASEIAARDAFLGRGFSMFEFTHLGIIVSLVGGLYLFTVGRQRLPERVEPMDATTATTNEYVTDVVVPSGSALVGRSIDAVIEDTGVDAELLHLVREEEIIQSLGSQTVEPGDVIGLRTDRETLADLIDDDDLALAPETTVEGVELEPLDERPLVELVVAYGSSLTGATLNSVGFYQRYGSPAFALRQGGADIRERIDNRPIRSGDSLLVQATPAGIDRFDDADFVVGRAIDRPTFRPSKTPIAVGIVALVVLLATVKTVPMMVAALTGALLMVLSGCLEPSEVYDAIDWEVIFLIAGVLPLGIALENTGTTALIAALVVESATYLPTIAVLGLFYLTTAVLTNIISNQASVVLMVPVAAETAVGINSEPISFIIAVMFAASTAFTTPIGYQTNLLVYDHGGYQFSDFVRVGAPLQLLLGLVSTLCIAVFWGV